MPETNIFNLDDPHAYECLIGEYHLGHSNMTILIRKKVSHRHVLWVNFESIEYFAGHIRWHGADFHIEPMEQCINILKSGRPRSPETLDKLRIIQTLKLYSVATQEGATVNIIAGSFSVMDEDENLIQQNTDR